MKPRTILKTLLLPLLCLALIACNDQTAKALRDTAIGLNSSAKIISTLHTEGVIADDAYPQIVQAQIEVVKTHKEAVQFIRLVGTITPENKGEALLKVDAFLASLERLQAQGLTHIKNPQKQLYFTGIVAGIHTNVAVVRAFIAAVKKPTRITV